MLTIGQQFQQRFKAVKKRPNHEFFHTCERDTKGHCIAANAVGNAADYRQRDLHAEGQWPPMKGLTPEGEILQPSSYGGILFNEKGQVLLREPKGHYDGYHWTFAKGRQDEG